MLGGRNWVQDTDENKPPFLRDGAEGGNLNRLDVLPLEDVLETAEHVIEVRFFFFGRSLAHRVFFPLFCRSLAQKAKRVVVVRGCAFFFFFSPLLLFSLARRDSLYTEKCCDGCPERDSVKDKERARERV